ncbi:MAG: GerMN domain-containing protein [Xenococcaceae cyanobacterium MO_188.B32]|nr:GerMN domain-containing protein [Xenococcaceae cyanobacterium MO_188.B32]
MQNKKQNRRFSLPLVAGITVAILALGGGTAWWAKYSLEKAESPANPRSSPVNPPVVKQPLPQPATEQKQVEICWLNPTGDKIELVTKTLTVQKSAQTDRLLKIALENLLSGTEEESYTTAIPTGTKLIDLNIDKEGIHVDLSQQFTSGGGSASMTGRLAQVLYTATSLDPDSKVWLKVEGEPLTTLGEEGLIINQPMTRSDFQNNFTL